MLRRINILTVAALALSCSLAPAAVAADEVAPPPSSMAASQAEEYNDLRSAGAGGGAQDLRSPDAQDAAAHRGLYEAERGPYALNRDYGSPDAVDAARDLPSVPVTPSGSIIYTDAERKLVESPEVQQMLSRIAGEISASSPVVAVSAPSGGFDWGDAGIGAAGMLALFSIAGGSALLLMGRRRRQGFGVATH
jgi:hypothetical protein